MTMQATIEQKLTLAFKPDHLQVINESGNHNVPAGSESHFRVVMVSDQFQGKRLLARHRLVNQTLRDELSGAIHALALSLHTPEKWVELGASDPNASPPCAHN